jgi:hypothetical protein
LARLEERGISDVLALTFMLLFAVLAGVFLHSQGWGAIPGASSRQLQLKAEYLYRTLELSQVRGYSLSYFQAIAENLIEIGEPVVPGNLLENELAKALGYLRPSSFGAHILMSYENRDWVLVSPPSFELMGEEFTFSGKVTIVVAEAGENRVAQVSAEVSLFRLQT